MKRLTLTIALILVFLPLALQAQTTQTEFCNGTRCSYIPLEPLPGQQIGSQGVDFGSYLNYAFTLFIVIGGMFAVATFVWGGIMYMVTDIAKSKDLGKKQMQRAVYGLLVLLGSYVLLYTINPQLVQTGIFDPNSVVSGTFNNRFQPVQQQNTTGSPQLTQQQRDNLLSGCPINSTGVRYDPDGVIVCF